MDYENNPILANEIATTPEKVNPEQLDRLYERHQSGKIWVESQGKDKGSTFRFIIPA